MTLGRRVRSLEARKRAHALKWRDEARNMPEGAWGAALARVNHALVTGERPNDLDAAAVAYSKLFELHGDAALKLATLSELEGVEAFMVREIARASGPGVVVIVPQGQDLASAELPAGAGAVFVLPDNGRQA